MNCDKHKNGCGQAIGTIICPICKKEESVIVGCQICGECSRKYRICQFCTVGIDGQNWTVKYINNFKGYWSAYTNCDSFLSAYRYYMAILDENKDTDLKAEIIEVTQKTILKNCGEI